MLKTFGFSNKCYCDVSGSMPCLQSQGMTVDPHVLSGKVVDLCSVDIRRWLSFKRNFSALIIKD